LGSVFLPGQPGDAGKDRRILILGAHFCDVR
jgi:hypothetical protein